MKARLHLFGRRDCHLCAEMRDALAAWRDPLDVVEHDVDAAVDLVRRFGTRVPVLVGDDGEEICHHFLDESALRGHLDRA